MKLIKKELKVVLDPPSLNDEGWEENVLYFLLNRMLSVENFKSVYAETISASGSVNFYLSNDRECMITKEREAIQIYQMSFDKFIWFISYLTKKICASEMPTIGCCILSIFEGEKRFNYTLYCRKSTILSCFFQIDQFHKHL